MEIIEEKDPLIQQFEEIDLNQVDEHFRLDKLPDNPDYNIQIDHGEQSLKLTIEEENDRKITELES